MGRKYSERLGIISDEQLQAALDRFGLGTLLFAEPAPGGLFGQNIMLRSTNGEFVFRGAPHWDADGNDDWQFTKERLFCSLVRDAPDGPPVPWPYLLDESRDIFGWAWAIMPRAEGTPVAPQTWHEFDDQARRGQATALGHALAQLHTVTRPAAGVYDRALRGLRPLERPYGEYVRELISQLLTQSQSACSTTTDSDVAWLLALIDEHLPSFDEPFAPTVTHLDFHVGNNVLRQSTDGWEVTAVVDWHTAEVGHPEADLCRLLAGYQRREPERRAFLGAYRARHPARRGYGERLTVLTAWERLLIWQYGQAHNVWFPAWLTLRQWLEPYLDSGQFDS